MSEPLRSQPTQLECCYCGVSTEIIVPLYFLYPHDLKHAGLVVDAEIVAGSKKWTCDICKNENNHSLVAQEVCLQKTCDFIDYMIKFSHFEESHSSVLFWQYKKFDSTNLKLPYGDKDWLAKAMDRLGVFMKECECIASGEGYNFIESDKYPTLTDIVNHLEIEKELVGLHRIIGVSNDESNHRQYAPDYVVYFPLRSKEDLIKLIDWRMP